MELRTTYPQLLVALLPLFGSVTDWSILIIYKTYKSWEFLRPRLQNFISQLNLSVIAFFLTLFIISFFTLQIYRCLRGFQVSTSTHYAFPVKPMLFPGRTAHARFFPVKHSFSYPYFMVGVPVGYQGTSGGIISVDIPPSSRNWLRRVFSLDPWGAWFTVDSDDYLSRGHVKGGLREKLSDYLQSQGEDPSHYPFTYLLTPPRFLGYYSNPVAIWHLYSNSKVLSAMILEVNNTFNERHMYFVKRPESVPSDNSSAETISLENQLRTKLSATWPKDFHVSVFSSRLGSYSVSAFDPLIPVPSTDSNGARTGYKQDTTLTLLHPPIPSSPTPTTSSTATSDTKNHQPSSLKPLLVARIYSTSPAIDPCNLSTSQKLSFLSKWWYVGFLTFPRTLIQAWVGFFRNGLPWVPRPEPRRKTTSRDADANEIIIEWAFRRLLREAVEDCERAVAVRYISSGLEVQEGEGRLKEEEKGEVMVSSSAQLLFDEGGRREEVEEMEIRILSPLFYSRITGYTSLLDGLQTESEESQTVAVTNLEALAQLLEFPTSPSPDKSLFNNRFGWRDRFRLTLLRCLRKRPSMIVNHETVQLLAKPPDPISANISTLPDQQNITPITNPITKPISQSNSKPSSTTNNSDLDNFIFLTTSASSPLCTPSPKKQQYFQTVLKLLIADHIAFSSPFILDLEISLLRKVFIWWIVRKYL